MRGDAPKKSLAWKSEQFIVKSSVTRSQKKRLFQKLVLAHSDIRAAYKTCELFMEKVASNAQGRHSAAVGLENPLYLPLLEAMIISYARPFTANNSLGVLQKSWSQFNGVELADAHRQILTHRNELVAHSDCRVRKIKIFSSDANFSPKIPGKIMIGPGFGVSTYWIPLQRIQVFHRLCAFQGNRLSEMVMNMLDELYGKLEIPNKAFDLRIDDGL